MYLPSPAVLIARLREKAGRRSWICTLPSILPTPYRGFGLWIMASKLKECTYWLGLLLTFHRKSWSYETKTNTSEIFMNFDPKLDDRVPEHCSHLI